MWLYGDCADPRSMGKFQGGKTIYFRWFVISTFHTYVCLYTVFLGSISIEELSHVMWTWTRCLERWKCWFQPCNIFSFRLIWWRKFSPTMGAWMQHLYHEATNHSSTMRNQSMLEISNSFTIRRDKVVSRSKPESWRSEKLRDLPHTSYVSLPEGIRYIYIIDHQSFKQS